DSEDEHSGAREASLDRSGWRRVMTYWRALYGDNIGPMLEVRAHRDATTPGELQHALEAVPDAELREILRQAMVRTAVVDTPWSAAFISYVVRQAGVAASAFQFSNAHRAYIYDAFETSAAEAAAKTSDRLYRACPLSATKPRVGDIICNHREPALADA